MTDSEETAVVETPSHEIVMPDQENVLSIIAKAAGDEHVDADKAKVLYEIAKEERAIQAKLLYTQAMARAQERMPQVHKGDKADKYSYAKLERIYRACAPVWTSEGFSLSFGTKPASVERWVRIVCDVAHTGGHVEQYEMEMPLDDVSTTDKRVKTDIHAVGSTYTYGQRYLTCKVFNIPVGDDTDAQSGEYERISPEEAEEIDEYITDLDLNREAFMNWLKQAGIEELEDIPAKEHQKVWNRLKKASGHGQ